MASFTISIPRVYKGLEPGQSTRMVLGACFADVLRIDFSQREERGFPGLPRPAWLEEMVIPGLMPLVADGIIKKEYVAWLEKGRAGGRKRAHKEAWQWFVLACWCQFQIKQVDPFEAAS